MEETRARVLRGWEWFRERAHTKYARVWLFSLFFLESIIFPIPPDPLLIALTVAHRAWWFLYASIATLGSTLGAVFGYFLGVFFFESVGMFILNSYGLLGEVSVFAERLYAHTFSLMILGALTPLPFKVFVLSGGFLGVPFIPFILGTLLGRSFRYFALAYLTHRFGDLLTALVVRYLNRATLALTVLAVFLFLVYKFFL